MQIRYRLKTFFMSNFGVGVTALIVLAVIFGVARARLSAGEGGATAVSTAPTYSPSPTATGPSTVSSATDKSTAPVDTPTPSPADAQTPLVPSPTVTQLSYPVARLTADMDLRSGPGIDFPIVGAAAAGNTFRITGRHPAGEWWQIEVAAGPAWVYALFVQVEGPIESLGYTAVLPPPPPPVSTSTPFPTPSSRCPGDCAEAHERGLSNMSQDHLCYRPELDSDGNGIACERNR